MKNDSHVFISHSSRDDRFVRELARALEDLGVPVWADSRELVGGSKLAPEIEKAIETARHFVAVLSPDALGSAWVRREVGKALEVARGREGYRVVPLMLPGVVPEGLKGWFGEGPEEERVGVPVEANKAGGLREALPAVLAALGERRPDDLQRIEEVVPPPFEELVLKLHDLEVVEESEGVRRARGTAQLVYEPAEKTAREVESRRYVFTAPLGPIEAEELRWYLEEYFVWPVGVFGERARRVESQLPRWGQALYRAALGTDAAREALTSWQQPAEGGERRFSVFVDKDLPEGATDERQAGSDEAAAEILALPWELLHDGRGFLFHGRRPARVRRRLPNRYRQKASPTRLPIRILLASPRPEVEGTSYIDHRISALPLVEAVEDLGDLARLTVLAPATFAALEKALKDADEAGESFDVLHFDGHGVYDRRVGLGGLCFEDPADAGKLDGRAVELVHAERLAEVMRDYRVPLVFLEACQSAKTDTDPTASVAARLLSEGVASVVAMTHSVLVETARRFVGAFYKELARGRRVGAAMLEGQLELYRDTARGRMLGAGDLRLQDWFVPVLYQEEHDPQLVAKLPPEAARQLDGTRRRLSLGALPEPPPHQFIGRSRELLALERLLNTDPWAVIRGQGGEGKTTLAAELARWLVRTGRHERAAFVSLEHYTDARGALDALGRQLLPEGDAYSVANFSDFEQALQPVERALRDRSTVVVFDNLESVLPDAEGRRPPGAAPFEELFDLCQRLLHASASTRLLFTTREPLPAPFDDPRRDIPLGPLTREDAVRLVSEVMKREGREPKSEDPGADPREVVQLVEAANRHARALVLLSREIAHRGVLTTTEDLRHLMADLHDRYPDDRENSLYASIELSLRRLPQQTRSRLPALAPFHNGAHLYVLAQMLGEKLEAVMELARQLIQVGLAQDMGDGHLRLDPALPSYLLRGMSEDKRNELKWRWAAGMAGLADFLYLQLGQDAGLSARLTLRELPNLLALLRWGEGEFTPELMTELSSNIERVLSQLGHAQALAEVVGRREQAAKRLEGWGRAHFAASITEVDRLIERGETRAALAAATQLLRRSIEAGEDAYPEAAYDITRACLALGRAYKVGGAAAEALPLLEEAQRRFETLAQGDANAARMACVALIDLGDALNNLGRLDEAAESYEESIRRAVELGDKRNEAIAKGQLGSARLGQGRYKEALDAYEGSRQTFEELGEPRAVAAHWHQIGIVYRQTQQYEQAERAYRQSLAIEVQQGSAAGEALSLTELGSLYAEMGKVEEAVKLFRQAADICVKIDDPNKEGMARTNLAFVLLFSRRYEEARSELARAIECRSQFGHAAELWKAWHILHQIEVATGNPGAAARARQRAYESYLAYRREGGYGTTAAARLCAMAAAAIAAGDTSKLEQVLSQPVGEEMTPNTKVIFLKVLAVLRGKRSRDLAEDPELDYDGAVELMLLLERLNEGEGREG